MRLPTKILFIAVIDAKDGNYKEHLDEEGRQRRDRRIPRAALKKFKYSSSIIYCSTLRLSKIETRQKLRQKNIERINFLPTYYYFRHKMVESLASSISANSKTNKANAIDLLIFI